MNPSPFRAARATILAALVATAACDPQGGSGPSFSSGDDPTATVFIAQDVHSDGPHMDALYQGRVVLDEQGCLRIDGGDQHTVVWPYGYTLEARGNNLFVRNAQGADVGRIGGDFRFAGGEVTSLDHLPISAQKRALATERCPGRYWIAS